MFTYTLVSILEAIHAYNTGEQTVEQISKAVGCTQTTILKWISRWAHGENHRLVQNGFFENVNLRDEYNKKYPKAKKSVAKKKSAKKFITKMIIPAGDAPFSEANKAYEKFKAVRSKIEERKIELEEEIAMGEEELARAKEAFIEEVMKL